MKAALVLVVVVLLVLPLNGARPTGEFGGSKQMDIERLEKVFGAKFSIPFPAERFDIDYFSKGDLAVVNAARGKVLVTCPYVVGPMVAFAMGGGEDAGTFKPAFDVSVDFDDAGKFVRLSIANFSLKEWPKPGERPARKDAESVEAYLSRSRDFWLAAAGKTPDAAVTWDIVNTAFKLVRACLEQGGGQLDAEREE